MKVSHIMRLSLHLSSSLDRGIFERVNGTFPRMPPNTKACVLLVGEFSPSGSACYVTFHPNLTFLLSTILLPGQIQELQSRLRPYFPFFGYIRPESSISTTSV